MEAIWRQQLNFFLRNIWLICFTKPVTSLLLRQGALPYLPPQTQGLVLELYQLTLVPVHAYPHDETLMHARTEHCQPFRELRAAGENPDSTSRGRVSAGSSVGPNLPTVTMPRNPMTWQMQPALLMHFNKMSRRYTHVIIYSINSHFFTQCFPWGQPFLWYLRSETALQACLHHATGKPSGKIYGTVTAAWWVTAGQLSCGKWSGQTVHTFVM